MIRLITLGRSSVLRDRTEVTGVSRHKQKTALLIYLAVEGPVSRDLVLDLFWPNRPQEKARHSLSQALYIIKKTLEEECVDLIGNHVGVTAGLVTDAQELEAAVGSGRWDRAVDLYQGPFLAQFYLPGAPAFDQWQRRTQVYLARLARHAFGKVIESRVAAGDLQGALSVTWRWVTLEPLEDEANHAFIGLLARSGDRAGALNHYQAYRDRLIGELGVEPLGATMSLIERVKAGDVPRAYLPLGDGQVGMESRESDQLTFRWE